MRKGCTIITENIDIAEESEKSVEKEHAGMTYEEAGEMTISHHENHGEKMQANHLTYETMK